MWSRDLIKQGSRWKVGNGKNIEVFHDSWVADGSIGSRLQGRNSFNQPSFKVESLIGPNRDWNDAALERLLWPHEAEVVRRTPIGEHGDSDEICWRLDPRGLFSVKTAYLLEIGFFEADPFRSAPNQKFWSQMVWSITIPPKAKVFLWRALSNIIPTTANLKTNHVPTDGICGHCRDRWDSTEHCLIFCPLIRQSWKESRFWRAISKMEGLNLVDIAMAIKNDFERDEYELWSMMLWQIWVFKCQVLHGGQERRKPPKEEEIAIYWEEFQEARPTFLSPNVLGVKLGAKTWQRPKRGCFRVDVDALFCPAENKFGVGIVIRNGDGNLLLAVSKRTSPTSNAMLGEVMAIVYGIIACIEHQLLPVEIFTDSLAAARVMANPEEEHLFLPDDVREILNCARENMLVGVFHMYRTANRAAHSVAQFARIIVQSECWTTDFPRWLRDIVFDDISST